MWLYVPNLSTSCPSAPAEEASISESNWRFPALAHSAWWRGKPSQSRTWYQRWNKVSWLRLLCGAMPEPSTADAGVDVWTASLAASRASRGVVRASGAERMTSATYGRPRVASLSSRGSGSFSSKTFPAWSTKAAPSEFGETFSDLVLRWRADCSARLKRVQRSGAIGFSFWQSPTTRDAKGQSGRGNRIKRGNGDRLHVANLCDQLEDMGRHDLIRSVSFRETLMGWPDAFCDIAMTRSACAVTEFTRWRQEMRSALSAIALPAEAPPAQLALFG